MSVQELREQVLKLPVTARLELVEDIINSIQVSPQQSDDEMDAAFNRMRGLLKMDTLPPSDEEIASMLEERRLEKFS
ncbi:MAG: hypothetical protein AAF716_07180 [Cyanobacteria bacterium P01_D01_bin.1]